MGQLLDHRLVVVFNLRKSARSRGQRLQALGSALPKLLGAPALGKILRRDKHAGFVADLEGHG